MSDQPDPSISDGIGYDPTDLAVAINLAHGAAIDARTATRTIGDQVRNQIAGDVGRAQGAAVKAFRYASEKVAKSAGRAQAAVDGALADISQAIQGDIQSAVVPLVELGVDLPSQREITLEKQRLLGVPQPLLIPAELCRCDPHNAPEPVRIKMRLLIVTTEKGYCCTDQTTLGQMQQQRLNSYAPAVRLIRTFNKWWQAELACILLTQCRWTEAQLMDNVISIDQIQIYTGSGGGAPVPVCEAARLIWPVTGVKESG